MSTLPNPLGPQRQPPAKRPFVTKRKTKRKWNFEILEACRALAGLTVIVSTILLVLFRDSWIVGVGTVITLIIAVVLFFFQKLRQVFHRHAFLTTLLLCLLTVGLALVLHSFVIPQPPPTDPWLRWKTELEGTAGKCTKKTDDTDKNKCLVEELAPVINGRPGPHDQSDVTGLALASDLRAGQAMMENVNTKSILHDRFSVDARFLGTGLSEPVGQSDITAARVPEYIVPNLSDKLPYVWAWELDRGQVQDQNLLEILKNNPPTNHSDFKENLDRLQAHLQPNDPRPVLVRFALLDPQNYSRCLGRPNATRVFMSDLGELKSKTVGEAELSSGYVVPENSTGKMLFIWVYAPMVGDPVVKATWGNVLSNFKTWITSGPCQSAK